MAINNNRYDRAENLPILFNPVYPIQRGADPERQPLRSYFNGHEIRGNHTAERAKKGVRRRPPLPSFSRLGASETFTTSSYSWELTERNYPLLSVYI